jgi:transposase InsO family protein
VAAARLQPATPAAQAQAEADRDRAPDGPDDVWSYDFIEAQTIAGRKLRILSVIDEYTRRCLALVVEYHQSAAKVVAVLDWLFTTRGRPQHLRSDNGPEFIAGVVQAWLAEADCGTIYIEPGKPWQNAYVESFHGRLRAECLNQEAFEDRAEAEAVLEAWRTKYNGHRPHSSLGWLSPEAYLRHWQDGQAPPDPPIVDGT